MSHRLSFIDRVIVFVVSVLAIAGGVIAIAWAAGTDFGAQVAGLVDWGAVHSVMDTNWYPVTLILVFLLAGALGLWLIVANLRRHHFNKIASAASSDAGDITLSTHPLAKAMAAQLKSHPDVEAVESNTSEDRGQRTVTITVHTSPDVRLGSLVHLIESIEEDFRAALPGVDIDTRYLVKLQPVQ